MYANILRIQLGFFFVFLSSLLPAQEIDILAIYYDSNTGEDVEVNPTTINNDFLCFPSNYNALGLVERESTDILHIADNGHMGYQSPVILRPKP